MLCVAAIRLGHVLFNEQMASVETAWWGDTRIGGEQAVLVGDLLAGCVTHVRFIGQDARPEITHETRRVASSSPIDRLKTILNGEKD